MLNFMFDEPFLKYKTRRIFLEGLSKRESLKNSIDLLRPFSRYANFVMTLVLILLLFLDSDRLVYNNVLSGNSIFFISFFILIGNSIVEFFFFIKSIIENRIFYINSIINIAFTVFIIYALKYFLQ